MFFFEKKNQKTFVRFGFGLTRRGVARALDRSLFASFSSENEESFFTLLGGPQP
jgi:hypothetical protein